MHALQRSKGSALMLQTSLTANSTGTAYVDTLGFTECRISVWGSSLTNSNVPDVLKISESDDTYYSNSTDIVSGTGGTSVVAGSTGFVIGTQGTNSATALDPLAVFDVPLEQGRKRYLFVATTPHTTCNWTMTYNLTGPRNYGATAAEAGIVSTGNHVVVT